ncbi:hypothetical protein [Bradyrhizobium cajani]|uniref:Uncharacterized protein n=1 Tax=Bradyrhizobium cajani TaxID=1928661 RepID=A0A844TG62_9BRAD|nr:hypothetical protein [Bradyrhizobium cajani]MCP3367551.1 hypothetical protein [Bradyrhizobium cajani]MVT73610.1 hypothetical protein [Bradyrhizobium cajani]
MAPADRRYRVDADIDRRFLDLRLPPHHLGMREVAVAVVHRLELAAVDCDAWCVQQAGLPDSAMNFAQTFRIAAPLSFRKLGDRLMIGSRAADQLHQLDIAARLRGDHTLKTQSVQIERLDKHIDNGPRSLAYPILQTFRPSTKRPILIPIRKRKNLSRSRLFTQPGS